MANEVDIAQTLLDNANEALDNAQENPVSQNEWNRLNFPNKITTIRNQIDRAISAGATVDKVNELKNQLHDLQDKM